MSKSENTNQGFKVSTPQGNTGQYVRGDGSLASFPTIPNHPVQADWSQKMVGRLDYIKNKPCIYYKGVKKDTYITHIMSTTVINGVATFDNSIFNVIWPEICIIKTPSLTDNFISDDPVLSGDKTKITCNVVRESFTSSVQDTLSFITGRTWVSAVDGTIVYLTVFGE